MEMPDSVITESDRLSLVSSLYGPGAVGCSLCLVCSVFISWTLNRKTNKTDNITSDLVAALTLPAVAAVHLIYQVANYPGDRSAILTTQDPDFLPRVAAIEAALNVCETFAALALALFVVAAVKLHILRCFAVAVVGLLAFGAESALFVISPNAPIPRSNFSRPFILNEHIAMIPMIGITLLLSIASLMAWVAYVATSGKENHSTSRPQIHGRERSVQDGDDMAKRDTRNMRILTMVSMFFLPLSLLTSGSFPLGLWGVTAIGALHGFAWRLWFFIPATSCSITDLDQAVALAGGIATLGFGCYDAITSRHKAKRPRRGSEDV